MRQSRAGHSRDDAVHGPDYNDLSRTAIAYRWVSRRQGREPGSQDVVTGELAEGLAEYAAGQDARLVGSMRMDFPEHRALPRDVRRSLLKAMWLQERWWRFGDLVLVRAWQNTEPVK